MTEVRKIEVVLAEVTNEEGYFLCRLDAPFKDGQWGAPTNDPLRIMARSYDSRRAVAYALRELADLLEKASRE